MQKSSSKAYSKILEQKLHDPLDKLLFVGGEPLEKLLGAKKSDATPLEKLFPKPKFILEDLLNVPQTKTREDQINAIIERNIRENKSFKSLVNDLEKLGDVGVLQRAYDSLATNFKKYIFYGIVGGVATVTLISAASFFGAGAGVYAILKLLIAAGTTQLPTILYPLVSKLAKSVGTTLAPNVSINAVLGLAKKNTKFARLLETKIHIGAAERILRNMGVISENDVITRELVFKKLVQLSVSAGSTLLLSGPNGLISLLGYDAALISLRVSRNTAKGIYKNIITGINKVVDASFTSETSIDKTITKTIHSEVRLTSQFLETKKSLSRQNNNLAYVRPSDKVVETTSDMKTLRSSSVGVVVAGSIASVLVGYALTPEETLKNIITGASQLSEHHTLRVGLASFLINSIGISKLSEIVSKTQFQLLQELVKTPNKPGFTNEFFSLLVGDRIYSREELLRLNSLQLLEIIKAKRIKLPRGATPSSASAIKAILKNQNTKIEKITYFISEFLVQSTASVATNWIAEHLANINYTKELETVRDVLYTKLENEKFVPGEKGFVLNPVTTPKTVSHREEAKKAHREATQEQVILKERNVAASKRAFEDAKERRLNNVAERVRKSLVKTGLMTVGIAKNGDSVVINDDTLISEKMKEALKGITFTPGINKAIKIIKDSTLPNIGGDSSIGSVLRAIPVLNNIASVYNVASDAASSAISIGRIVAAAYDKDISQETDNLLSGLKGVLDHKLMTATDVANTLKDAVGSETEMLVLKDVVLEALKKGALEGLSTQAIAFEIGSRIIFGNKIMDFDISSASIQDYGKIVAGLVLS